MESIQVALAENIYEISIAPGNLDLLGAKCRALQLGNKVMVVSNPTVFALYGQRAIAALQQADFEVAYCELPDGERDRTLDSISYIYDLALDRGLERSSTLVTLGGGAIGNLTGFAAATWLDRRPRIIRFDRTRRRTPAKPNRPRTPRYYSNAIGSC